MGVNGRAHEILLPRGPTTYETGWFLRPVFAFRRRINPCIQLTAYPIYRLLDPISLKRLCRERFTGRNYFNTSCDHKSLSEMQNIGKHLGFAHDNV
jgi:hypothetical protein